MYKTFRNFYIVLHLETPYKGMENTEAGLKVHVGDKEVDMWTMLKAHPLEIDMNSTLSRNILGLTSNINFNGRK